VKASNVSWINATAMDHLGGDGIWLARGLLVYIMPFLSGSFRIN